MIDSQQVTDTNKELTSPQIAERCKREVRGSKTFEQLAVALEYGLLAKKQGHLTNQDIYDLRYHGFWRKISIQRLT